jgi:hypothetical protein
MAFSVQDDNGSVVDANAYVTVAFFKAYHDDRGQSYSGFNDTQIQQAVVRATQYLDGRFTFVGYVPDPDQTTQWPRVDARDNNDRVRIGIPREIKNSTSEYALIALSANINPTPTRDESGATVSAYSKRAGPVSKSVEYAEGAVFKLPKYPVADNWLFSSGLVERSGRIHRA